MNSARGGLKSRGRRGIRGAVGAMVAVGALLGGALPAQAEDCTPSEAWTKTIPAVGEPTILVDNPDYQPAKPAVYRTVHHDEETTITTAYQRYTWTPPGQVGQTPDLTGSTPLTQPGEWQANTQNYRGTDPLNQAFAVSDPAGGVFWHFWQTISYATTPAWDEEVLVSPAVPAQGEPQIEQPNPDYRPSRTVEHPAVLCADQAASGADDQKTPSGLADTGFDPGPGALAAGAFALLGIAGIAFDRRRATASRRRP